MSTVDLLMTKIKPSLINDEACGQNLYTESQMRQVIEMAIQHCKEICLEHALYYVDGSPKAVALHRCADEIGLNTDVGDRVKNPNVPKCCVCDTTENLHKDGWHGYRCNSPDCVCF